MKRLAVLSSVFAAAFLAAAASASVVNDASLVSPSTNPADPGWYDGTGNPNGGFTVSTNGIELGLRAKLRQSPNVIDSATNTYVVPAGAQIGSPTHAAWNYEFSIDLRPGGVGSLSLSDITATLTITDLTTSASATVNPLNGGTFVADDTGWGASGKDAVQTGADWGAQNSENPVFANFPIPFNENNLDTYQFTLTVSSATAGVLATDTIDVQVIAAPLPKAATSGVALIGLLGAGLFFRKRRQMA